MIRRTHTTCIIIALVFGLVGPMFAQDEKPASPEKTAAKKKTPSRVAVRHVLIGFEGLQRPIPGVTRKKEEAKKLAEEALQAAKAEGADFLEIIKKYSDDPNKAINDGVLGILQKGRVHASFREFEAAVFALEIDGIAGVLETPMGFHVAQRIKIVEYSASHILIQYKGSERAKPDIMRTKEEAKKLAEDIVKQAKVEGADFAALAKKHSDGPSGKRGGSLGTFGPGQMVPEFEKALQKLAVGGVSGVVETAFGFHVIRRDKIERIGTSHILIQYKGSLRAKPTVTRTKDEAKELATKLSKEANATNFAELAKKNSDGPSGPNGGSLGLFERCNMVPAFEKAAFALEVGGVSAVVETQFGFHVILRTE